ncbi:zinc finger protein ZAT2-like isoform X1 [Zingiber officinale]|uniref:C2H2-type domain-containing protein n=2 Tax=Zingiber officinale TaxID=94328 RepID=A0A8J5FF38_ZINOF|nr:zinc finger protein ZAT2-like isoform X1 [Zingiber officinale]XP_042420609.1 zinc finger protein ZAT2-like isoform X1 [Zingiber officinale]XP_042420610.1 zinc finger protein ZAT2-like isoform X1 [Zingiber officinale]XP_042420611.1 zinc finger protein ZAT2-like isoform X1 [Zingiber officinale]XP_042420612.1 zinc finger protein ZAT2-like isoform X1 [Zingiber officinale]XP_042420613.1 zinc finger protein ZAT2-like isoform X1 [Zingiber officinale]XP_042420614.1 zinc finger protein ZAT2-like is
MADHFHSMKMASNPNLTCPECRKIFPSEKSMYGHLRSHPERDYRGVNRQAPTAKKNRKTPAKTRRDRAATTSDGNDIDPEVVAALLLLSDPDRLLEPPRSGFNDRNALDLDGYQPEPTRRKIDSSGNRIYRCDTCFKVFSSHQALGGHVASHNKNKIVAAASIHPGEPEKGAAIPEHKCKLCGMIFSSGQALGGHQRRHFKELCHRRAASPSALSSGGDEIASNQASASSPETEEEGPAKRRDFDLNMEPFLE